MRAVEAGLWALAGAAAGAALTAYFVRSRIQGETRPDRSGPDNAGGRHTARSLRRPVESSPVIDPLEDDILAEQLTRNVQFFGQAGQAAVCAAFVVVVGLGGVGSHAAHLLLRSGVPRLRLVDFDQVSLSSLNRHAVADRADVGLSKAECLKAHFARIVPEARVEAATAMFTADTAAAVLGGAISFVIDAIDNVDTKVALLAACVKMQLPVVCVAGAGAKADPSRLRIADISESSVDPLARAVRHRLRREHSIESGIPVVLSTEKPRCALVTAGEEGANLQDYQTIPNFRIRTIPVLGTTPALFGLAAAAHVLCALAGAPFAPEPLFRVPAPQLTALHARLTEREELVYGNGDGLGVDLDEVEFLVREVWRARSALAHGALPGPETKGLSRSTAGLTLTRWDATKPATPGNLVLLSFAEAEAHEDDPGAIAGDTAARIEATLASVRCDFGC